MNMYANRHRFRIPLLALCVLVCLCLGEFTALAKPTVIETEPTVSRREAEQLEKAAAVATTNAAGAIAILNTDKLTDASAALDFAIGNFHFQAGALEAAEAAYRAAIEKFPTFRNARKNLGRVYLLRDEPAAALAVYQALIEDGWLDANTAMLLGHTLLQQARFVAAESAYRQALLLAPDQLDIQQGLARCLLQQERHREARSLLRSIIAEAPQRGDLWSLLAKVNIALDAPDAAIRALEMARHLKADNAVMLGQLGDLYLNAGQPEDAVKRYEAAIAGGWTAASRLLRAVHGFMQLGDAERAGRLLDQIAATDLTTPEEILKRLRLEAELAALQGHPKQAIARYRKLLDRNPLDGKALLRLGNLLAETHAHDAAALAYERAERIEETQVEALIKRAELALKRDRFSKAVERLEAAQAIDSRPHVGRYLEQVRRLAQQQMDHYHP